MKNKILFFSVISIFLIFIGCSETSKTAEPETLVLNRKALSFDEKESSGDIYVSSNAKWTIASSDETWLSSSVSSGEGNSGARITATANILPDLRAGVITITTAGGESRMVDVTQSGKVFVTEIKINKSELSLTVADAPAPLTATVVPENATEKDVEWKSDAPQIAEVDQNGRVTPKSEGTATITATAKDGSGKFAACIVSITKKEEDDDDDDDEIQIPDTNGLGTGWSLYAPTKKIHLSQSLGNTETVLYTYNWVAYQEQKANGITEPVAHYRYIAERNEEEFYFYRTGTNRSEIRLENNYTSGTRQFEGYVTFDLNTNDESIMQVFGSNDAGNATLLMLRAFNTNGGEIRISSSTVIATGARSRWHRINVIHMQPVSSGNVVTTPGRVIVYVDGVKKFEKADNAIPTSSNPNYFKYGCYGTVNASTVPARVLWRNVKVFQNGQPPQ